MITNDDLFTARLPKWCDFCFCFVGENVGFENNDINFWNATALRKSMHSKGGRPSLRVPTSDIHVKQKNETEWTKTEADSFNVWKLYRRKGYAIEMAHRRIPQQDCTTPEKMQLICDLIVFRSQKSKYCCGCRALMNLNVMKQSMVLETQNQTFPCKTNLSTSFGNQKKRKKT